MECGLLRFIKHQKLVKVKKRLIKILWQKNTTTKPFQTDEEYPKY